MERKFELKIGLNEEMRNHFNIDTLTPFIAYVEDGNLIVEQCGEEVEKAMDQALKDQYSEGYDRGYEEGGADKAVEEQEEGYRRGYAQGYFDAQHGIAFHNENPDEDEEGEICPDRCIESFCGDCEFYDSENNTCAFEE